MKRKTVALLLALAVGVGCGRAVVVRTVAGETSLVTGHRTFAVQVKGNKGKNVGRADVALTEQVKEVVVRHSLDRGYQEAKLDRADLVIWVDIEVTGYVQFPGPLDNGPALRGLFGLRAQPMGQLSRSRQEATLRFDIVDSAASKVLWRASAKSRLTENGSAGQLEDLVARIIEQLPVPGTTTS